MVEGLRPQTGWVQRKPSHQWLQHWPIILAAYSYDIEYRPTLQFANADGLSHLPVEAGTVSFDETSIFKISVRLLVLGYMCHDT